MIEIPPAFFSKVENRPEKLNRLFSSEKIFLVSRCLIAECRGYGHGFHLERTEKIKQSGCTFGRFPSEKGGVGSDAEPAGKQEAYGIHRFSEGSGSADPVIVSSVQTVDVHIEGEVVGRNKFVDSFFHKNGICAQINEFFPCSEPLRRSQEDLCGEAVPRLQWRRRGRRILPRPPHTPSKT